MIAAVIFDLDGVIIDSEPIWEDVRRTLLAAYKLPYPADATRAIMGMSSPEWSAYLHDVLRVPLPASEINVRVVAGVAAALEARLPLFRRRGRSGATHRRTRARCDRVVVQPFAHRTRRRARCAEGGLYGARFVRRS